MKRNLLYFHKVSFIVCLCLVVLSRTSAASSSEKSIFISEKTYQKLTPLTRKNYLKEVHRIMAKFEEELNNKLSYSFNPLSIFISSAVAGPAGKCLVGGVEQPMKGDLCSTRNNSCADESLGSADTFKCGPIFSNACILRTPVKTISIRCRQVSDNLPVPTPENFKDIKANYETIYENHCTSAKGAVKSMACNSVQARMAGLSKAVAEPTDIATPKVDAPKTTATSESGSTADQILPDASCIDITQNEKCALGSLTVGKIIISKYMTDKIGLLECVAAKGGGTTLYSGLSETEMIDFVEKHKSNQAVKDGLAALSLTDQEFLKVYKNELELKKQGAKLPGQAVVIDDEKVTEDSIKNLERFAQVYNQVNKKCDAIKKVAEDRKGSIKKSCSVNQTKYKEIMEDRQRCNPKMDAADSCNMNLYQALAELASCDEYNIKQIGLNETMRAKGNSAGKACAISLKDASATIGSGTLEVSANSETKAIAWSAGYDLACKNNDLNFWRAQLGPKFAEAFAAKGSAAKGKGGEAGADSQR